MSEAVDAFETAKRRASHMATWRLRLWVRLLSHRIARDNDEIDKARRLAVEAVLKKRAGTTVLGQQRPI